MFPMLYRLTMLRSEPTDKWNASAMARPLTLGEVSMTRRIHSSDKRPPMLLENVCAASWEVSCSTFAFCRERQALQAPSPAGGAPCEPQPRR